MVLHKTAGAVPSIANEREPVCVGPDFIFMLSGDKIWPHSSSASKCNYSNGLNLYVARQSLSDHTTPISLASHKNYSVKHSAIVGPSNVAWNRSNISLNSRNKRFSFMIISEPRTAMRLPPDTIGSQKNTAARTSGAVSVDGLGSGLPRLGDDNQVRLVTSCDPSFFMMMIIKLGSSCHADRAIFLFLFLSNVVHVLLCKKWCR